MAKNFFPALAIILAALFVYWPALNGACLLDDNLLVYSNTRLHSLAGLGKIWLVAPTTDYWPLTWTLLWLEWHLWGDAPLGYHLVSLALHITSAFLIWRILARLGLRRGWIGGLLFAVHPLAVESVAWISEIKNTLSLPLFLLAFDAWLDAEEGRRTAYPRSVAFYLLAMLAKTSTIMLPFVLVLYCWWKRGRVTRGELVRLVPYAVIALVLGVITLHFQNRGTPLQPVEPNGLVARLTLAGAALVFYLGKFLVPIHLLTIYPAWPLDPPTLTQVLALPAFAALVELLYFAGKPWTRHALLGFGFFFLTALPILGFVDMQWLQFSPVADHLIYLPMIGLVGLAAAAVDTLAARLRTPTSLAAITLLIATFIFISRANASRYADARALWIHTLSHNVAAWPAWNGLGAVLLDEGRPTEALADIEEAVHLNPDFAQGLYNLGNAELALGKLPDAISAYQRTLEITPRDANAHYNLANAFLAAGRIPDALQEYERALQLIPGSAEIRGNYGQALARAGRLPDALAQFQLAAQLDPTSAVAAYNLGLALEQSGRTADALAQYQRALQLDPGFSPAQQWLAHAHPAGK
jgi:tetratricopeptide (TPR) repeat protein